MPQIDQLAATYASQFFWLILVFAILYFGIAKIMLGKLEKTVDARQAKIDADLIAAEAARQDAKNSEIAFEAAVAHAQVAATKATAMAKQQASQFIAERLASVDKDLAEKLVHAEQKVLSAKQQATSHIEAVAATLAVDLIGKLTGTLVDEAAAHEAVIASKKGIADVR